MEEILKRELLIQGQAFATFLTIEQAPTGCKKSFHGPHACICCAGLL